MLHKLSGRHLVFSEFSTYLQAWVDPSLVDLIWSMMDPLPDKRPTAAKALEHPYFDDIK